MNVSFSGVTDYQEMGCQESMTQLTFSLFA